MCGSASTRIRCSSSCSSMRDVRLDSAATVALRLRLLEAAKSVPGVSHASLQESIPFGGMSSYPLRVAGIDSVQIARRVRRSTRCRRTISRRWARGSCAAAAFESTDRDGARASLVVGESMATVLWPGQDPIGHCVRVGARLDSAVQVRGRRRRGHSLGVDRGRVEAVLLLPAGGAVAAAGGRSVRARAWRRRARLLEPLRGAPARDARHVVRDGHAARRHCQTRRCARGSWARRSSRRSACWRSCSPRWVCTA